MNPDPRPRATLRARALFAVQLAALATGPAALALQPLSPQGSFDWGADVSNSDLRNDIHELSGNVRVRQGPTSIQAGNAQARGLRTDHSRWTFDTAVHIRTAEADLRSDRAEAAFVQGQIADARVQGTPAQFAQLGGPAQRQVRGQAGVIEYDINTGVVKLSKQVWFSNGKDEFRGEVVIYNLRDERLQINPDGQPGERVRGVIRQREPSAAPAQPPGASAPRTARPRQPAAGANERGT